MSDNSDYMDNLDDADNVDELRTERWCAGLRFTATRPLEPAECAALEARVRVLGQRLWIAIACSPVALIVPFAAMFLLPSTLGARWLDLTVVFTLALAALAVPTLLVLRARKVWRERCGFRGDLAAGDVECFEGTLETDQVLDEDQKCLLDSGLLVPKPGVAQHLDVFPISGSVAARRAHGPWAFVDVTIAEVAAGPSYAMRVEMPQAAAWIDGAPRARFLRRTLNPHERAEIDAHIRHLRRPGLIVALWATWLTLWAVACAFSPAGVSVYVQTRWPLVLVQIIVLAAIGLTYARGLRLAARLERDTRTGWALTLAHLQMEPDGAHDATVNEPAAHPEPARCVEFLPHSLAVWSEQGRPARWRNLRRAA